MGLTHCIVFKDCQILINDSVEHCQILFFFFSFFFPLPYNYLILLVTSENQFLLKFVCTNFLDFKKGKNKQEMEAAPFL